MNELRRSIRAHRRSLTSREQQQASYEVCRLVSRHPVFQSSKHIAFYHAADGEIDPAPLMMTALKRGKRCYLPVIDGDNQLRFARCRADTHLYGNQFGIPEPANTPVLPAWALQLVVTPLVAFDGKGWRLGMGGGYYDRCFAFKRRNRKRTPFLLGLAHSFQEVPKINNALWDIPLQGVATDKTIRLFNDNSRQHTPHKN